MTEVKLHFTDDDPPLIKATGPTRAAGYEEALQEAFQRPDWLKKGARNIGYLEFKGDPGELLKLAQEVIRACEIALGPSEGRDPK